MSDLVACHECDLLNQVQPLPPRGVAGCARCGAPLVQNKPDSIERALALTVAALVLFAVANAFPFLGLKSGWLVQETTLATGVKLLYVQGMHGLATLVALTCLVIPALQLLLLLYLLVPLKLGRIAPQSARLFRLLGHLEPWGMLEVFMLGILVTLVKLGHSVTLLPGIAIWAFAALIVVLAAQTLALDSHTVWKLLEDRA